LGKPWVSARFFNRQCLHIAFICIALAGLEGCSVAASLTQEAVSAYTGDKEEEEDDDEPKPETPFDKVAPEASLALPSVLKATDVISIVYEKLDFPEKPYGVVVSVVKSKSKNGFTIEGLNGQDFELFYDSSTNRYMVDGGAAVILDKRPSKLEPIRISGPLRVRKF